MTQTTLHPQIDPRLLSELPRFFGGWRSILRELIQNASRARSTTLDITCQDHTLTFRDDGVGLDDPQTLLTVAKSGWGEGVRDPAGMGVLSTLNPEIVTRVSFASRDWTFSLTPRDFMQASSVSVQPRSPQPGFTVTLHLHEAPALHRLQEDLKEARSRAPLTVRFQGEEIAAEVLAGEELRLSQGTVILEPHHRLTRSRTYWEGFPIASSLAEEAERLPVSRAAKQMLQGYKFVFLPTPDSGVLPKLPDRNAILPNATWVAAAHELADQMQQRVEAALGFIDLSTPTHRFGDLIRALHQTGTPLLPGTSSGSVLRAYLEDRGYRVTHLFDVTTEAALGDSGEDDDAERLLELYVQAKLTVPASSEEATALYHLRQRLPGLPYGDPTSFRNEESPLLRPQPWTTGRAEPDPYFPGPRLVLCRDLHFGEVTVPWFV